MLLLSRTHMSSSLISLSLHNLISLRYCLIDWVLLTSAEIRPVIPSCHTDVSVRHSQVTLGDITSYWHSWSIQDVTPWQSWHQMPQNWWPKVFCFQYFLRLTWGYSSQFSKKYWSIRWLWKREELTFAVIKSCLRFEASTVWWQYALLKSKLLWHNNNINEINITYYISSY